MGLVLKQKFILPFFFVKNFHSLDVCYYVAITIICDRIVQCTLLEVKLHRQIKVFGRAYSF